MSMWKPGRLSALTGLLLLSWLFAAAYWFGLASDRYLSEAKFVVQRSGGDATAAPGLSALLGGAGMAATTDALMLKERIQSTDMYEHLDRELGIRRHFSRSEADFLSRLDPDAPKEAFYRYMEKRLKVQYDDVSSILTVTAEAYAPDMAKKIIETVVEASEGFINGVGFRLAREQVEFASLQLNESRRQFERVSQRLVDFQNEKGLISPEQKAKSVSQIISKLEADLAVAKAELTSLTTYLSDNAQEVMAARARVRALKRQIARENRKLVGQTGKDGEKLNELNADFESLKLEAEFRADTYGSALTAFEAARIEASHKLKHLVVVESPALPEEPAYPRKAYNLLVFVLVSTLFYWILRLGIATVRDHKD